jgi:hypothetical protein
VDTWSNETFAYEASTLRAAAVPVTWHLDFGRRPAAVSSGPIETSAGVDAHLQCGHNRRPSAAVATEGNITMRRRCRSTQADPNSEEDANDEGGAGLPIRAWPAVCWLMLAGGNLVRQFLVASHRQDILLDLTGGDSLFPATLSREMGPVCNHHARLSDSACPRFGAAGP